jgi:hypothetical protein
LPKSETHLLDSEAQQNKFCALDRSHRIAAEACCIARSAAAARPVVDVLLDGAQ